MKSVFSSSAKLISLFVLPCLLCFVGCGPGESPIESRLKSDGYTPEKLAREIQVQYSALDATGGRKRESSSSNTARDDGRADRGPADAASRKPISFESVTEEIKSKIAKLQADSGDEVDVQAEVIAEIEKLDMQQSLKQKVIAALR